MAFPKHRDIFLAKCLLESIEDENYRNTRKLLVEHHANPNLLITDRNIAPIHYAAGMENTSFAEAAMKLILKCEGNPNVQTVEGETPLHVAVIWNRTLIVEMLLDHGADISITDNDNNTPINYAIAEKHLNLIPIFQSHVFEKKLQKKLDNVTQRRKETPTKTFSTEPKPFHHLEIPKSTDIAQILTPNRTHFNLKEASPFLLNIRKPTHKRIDATGIDRKQKETRITSANRNLTNSFKAEEIKSNTVEIIEISDSDENEDDDEPELVKNLFDLTEENIERHLATVVKRNRKDSLIHLWRNKVNESRSRQSLLPINENEFEAFITENAEDTETPSVESTRSVVTVVPADRLSLRHDPETDGSFFTAIEDGLLVKKDLKVQNGQTIDSKDETKFIEQTEEVYEHFDAESNIKFYENKLLTNTVKKPAKSLNTSSESGTCTDFPLPSDYDTDDLRKELRTFGDVPGPITKSTKRLYLKRLVRYKRRPERMIANPKYQIKCNFSVELQRTMRDDVQSLEFINEYAQFERQMVNGFQSTSAKNMREGNFKKSFIYLLIDPRIAANLLAESQIIPQREIWCRFLKSIFYVGKGKSSRPYAHLYDAIKIYHDKNAPSDRVSRCQESLKLDRIIEIWLADKGVICLPVFHNITPVEAYTREAAIIDCLGVENLTNIKRGDYYGISKSWSRRDRKKLGVLLLFKAMQVFMVEGESQLRPNDIK